MEEKNRFVNRKTCIYDGKVWVNCSGTKTASKNGVDLGEKYWVTRDGDIASMWGGHLKPLANKNVYGYYEVRMSVMKKGVKVEKTVRVHRIIAEIFIGDIPEGYVVDHKNRIRWDNRAENLRIVTVAENNLNTHRTKNSPS